MTEPPHLHERELFDAAGYLRLYPDVAEAITAGVEPTAWHHYDKHGRGEGRRANDVDAEFYLAAYPQAADDVAAGRAADSAAHYALFGRARGYLPQRDAPVPPHAASPETYGWLWTDLPQALDMVEGRLALGRLRQREAALLRHWVRHGCVTLDQVIDRDIVAAAGLELERAFAGALPELLFVCDAVAPEYLRWGPEINPHPAAALDPHHLSPAIRALIFAEPIAAFLGLLFDGFLHCAQSRGVLRDATPPAQQGSPSVTFSQPRQLAIAWIALEDIADPATALQHYHGSHRYPGLRGDRLSQRVAELGLEPTPWLDCSGQVVIRHADLVHGAGSLPELATRRGVLVHYSPRPIGLASSEAPATRLWQHGPHAFSTQYYPALEPGG